MGHVIRTGQCPEDLKLAWGSIKITWLFGATDQEILTVSVYDNTDHHNRCRRTELGNIFQVKSWMESMKLIKNPPLDSTKAIDIVKYALAMGDPSQPDVVPEWL